MRVAVAVFVFLCWCGIASTAADTPILERVVMVSRHGIRSPTRRVEVLESLTKHGWPTWPVAPGEMTEHGARNLALMADFLRTTYRDRTLLPRDGCPLKGAVEVWSDVADHRTRQSGDIWAERLAPGCGFFARHAPDGSVDPLFDATKTKSCPIGLVANGAALVSAARQSAGPLGPDVRHALEVLQGLLAPDACKAGGQAGGKGVCLVPAVDASREATVAAIGFARPIAEAIYLEYVQGMTATAIGWGQPVDAGTIEAIMPVHESAMGILRRTPTLAARRGAVMVRTILALLQGGGQVEGAPAFSPDAKVIMIAGHDSNLLYMAALLGLDWRLADQPSLTPPDGTLALEIWRAPASGRRTVRAKIYAQTLAQLREATVLDAGHAPDVVNVVPEACAGAGADSCDVSTFATSVEQHLSAVCSK